MPNPEQIVDPEQSEELDQSDYYFDAENLPGLRISTIPPSLRPGIVPLILSTRARVKKGEGQLRDILYEHAELVKQDPKRQRRITRMIERHFEQFPQEPREGFNNSRDFLRFNLEMNHILASEREMYNEAPLDFYPADPEMPDKKQSRVLIECADGRNSPALYIQQKDLLQRYSIEWLPFAGLIIVPELQSGKTKAETMEELEQNPDLKNEIFKRFDTIFGPKVKIHIQRKMHLPTLHKLDFEFQSHFHGKEFPHHGCGAHCSNFDLAQAETIKNAFLLEEWLKERYKTQTELGYFRIYRTGHDTGEGGNVYGGSYLDESRVSKEYYSKHAEMFEEAKRFQPPKQDERGIAMNYQDNHLQIDVEKHDEQVVRVSQTHFAHTLLGQSVLEISWTNNAKLIFQHIKVLLGIIEKNYRQTHPENPAIIHLDLPLGRPEVSRVFRELRSMITDDPELVHRFNSGTLEMVVTETDQKTLQSKEVVN